jgi:hypothetical protein
MVCVENTFCFSIAVFTPICPQNTQKVIQPEFFKATYGSFMIRNHTLKHAKTGDNTKMVKITALIKTLLSSYHLKNGCFFVFWIIALSPFLQVISMRFVKVSNLKVFPPPGIFTTHL